MTDSSNNKQIIRKLNKLGTDDIDVISDVDKSGNITIMLTRNDKTDCWNQYELTTLLTTIISTERDKP